MALTPHPADCIYCSASDITIHYYTPRRPIRIGDKVRGTDSR